MTFQFLCPQGHLLEGEESHMGMQCECPQCGTAFIIPTIDSGGQPVAESQEPVAPQAEPTSEIEIEPPPPFDTLQELEDAAKGVAPISVGDADELGSTPLADSGLDDEVLLHIPCPNGHELETPVEMIGQRAKCPHCGAEFRLRREKSIEYLRHEEMLERRQAKFWFQLAIIAASFVGVVILAMIIMMAMS